MTVSAARAALPEILDRVGAGEEVTITRHGRPVAVMIRPEALRARRAGPALDATAAVGAVLTRGRRARLDSGPGLREERAEALLAEVRAGRAGR